MTEFHNRAGQLAVVVPFKATSEDTYNKFKKLDERLLGNEVDRRSIK